MKRQSSERNHEIEALLERGRTIRLAPDIVRARVMARARATIATALAYDIVPAPAARDRHWGMALATSMALTLGAVGAGAALRNWVRNDRHAPARPPNIAAACVPTVEASSTSPVVAERPDSRPSRPRGGRSARAVVRTGYVAELDLLHRAQAAYVGGDFAGALAVSAEHARRFPNGGLAEEREALRVRSLAGFGHASQARHAAVAFAIRFPRSVLLPRLYQTARAAE